MARLALVREIYIIHAKDFQRGVWYGQNCRVMVMVIMMAVTKSVCECIQTRRHDMKSTLICPIMIYIVTKKQYACNGMVIVIPSLSLCFSLTTKQ